MPIYRITMGFTGRTQGWSEYHMLKTTETVSQNLEPLVTQLCQKRAQFLGAPYSIFGFRIAAYLNDDGTKAPRQSWFKRKSFTTSHPSSTGNAEPTDVAIIGIGTNPANVGISRFWMGAPPDGAVDNGGQVIPGNNQLGNDVNGYFGLLLNTGVTGVQFGWGVSGTGVDNQILKITQNANGTVSFQFTAPVNLPVAHTTFYPARIRQVNEGRSPLNGQSLVTVTAADTVTTKEIIAFNLAQAGGFVKIYPQNRQFAQYLNLSTNEIVGNHRRGRPFDISVGRAPRRVRG